jgi:uncharacterized protein (DUF58 family)
MSTFLWLYLAGALLIPGRPLYAVLYCAGGLYLLARLSLQLALGRLQVERELSEQRLFPGETLTVTLRFRNPTGVPIPWLQFTESRPEAIAGPLMGVVAPGAREEATVSYTLAASRRGRYRVGPIACEAGDPFGFLRLGAAPGGADRFTVYPRVTPLPDLGLPARLPLGDLPARRRLFEDPAWLAGTREYQPGDSLKRIHWNATARTGELMVKQFRHAVLLPCAILLNLARAEYGPRAFWQASELGITAAASLCQHLVSRKQQVALLVTGRDPDAGEEAGAVRLPLRQGQAAVAEVLEVLARIEAGDGPPFAAAVADEARRLPWGALLLIITPRETPELTAICARIAGGGQQVLLFLTESSGASGQGAGYQVYQLSETFRGEVALG